jgi:malic enzyme
MLQWEDFAPGNGRRILEKYRDRFYTFNDDMQGTGAITLAAGYHVYNTHEDRAYRVYLGERRQD